MLAGLAHLLPLDPGHVVARLHGLLRHGGWVDPLLATLPARPTGHVGVLHPAPLASPALHP
eukprot:10791249-Alexandrium_andersonii.AAC.1